MRKYLIAAAAVATLASPVMAATFAWEQSYTFDDASDFVQRGTQQTTWSSAGYGDGWVPRESGSWGPAATSSWASDPLDSSNGTMLYSATDGLSGGRLAIRPTDGSSINDFRADFLDAMSRANTPRISLDVYFPAGGYGVEASPVVFSSLITRESEGTPSGTNGVFSGMVISPTTGAVTPYAFTGTGLTMNTGWNTIAMDLTADGLVNLSLNGTVFNTRGSTADPYEWLSNPFDTGVTLFSFGSTTLQVDNLVLASAVPEPMAAMGGLSLLSLIGLRRRQVTA